MLQKSGFIQEAPAEEQADAALLLASHHGIVSCYILQGLAGFRRTPDLGGKRVSDDL